MSLVDTSTGEVIPSTLPVTDIVIGERARLDLGDLGDLKDSILAVGLLQPIVVDSDHELIAGRRRLAAVVDLGWTDVPVTIAASVVDAVDRITAERDENTCRKDFTPSEAVALGMRLEELVRPLADERRRNGNARGGHGGGEVDGDSPPTSGPAGPTRDIVAPAVGMKPSRYAHAKTVVTACDDPDPEVAAVAREAVAEMDETGSVETAYRKVTKVKKGTDSGKMSDARWMRAKRLASEGATSRQLADEYGIGLGHFRQQAKRRGITFPADDLVGRTHRLDSNRIVEQTALGLAGEAQGLDLVDFDDLDPDRIEDWATSISDSLRLLNRFGKRLKEMTQ